MTFAVGKFLILAAVIVFVLVTFGVTVGNLNELEETAAGLALGFASFLVP